MTRLSILKVFLMVVVCNTFEFNCPDRSQWKCRAGEKCNGSINMYFCIFDDNYNIYREFCHQDTRYNRGPEGETFVYRGNLDGKTCSSERYQPIKFNNMGNSDCIFTKSLCSSEGLVAYTNGSPTSERTCVCDCTKNYLFVTQPQNKSFCRPDIEDCSCGKKTCSGSYVIPRADFSCVSRENASSDAVKDCERIPISNEEEIILVLDNSSVEENSRVHNKKRPGKIEISACVITTIAVIISFIVPVINVIVGKPRILAQHEYYHAAIGAPVRIRFKIHSCCKLRSLNVRKIDRNGTTVISSDNIERHIDSTGTYAEVVFSNVHENDEGTYIALYNDIFGYDKCTVKLKVQALSRIHVNCKNDKNAVLTIQLSEKDKRTLQAVEWKKNTENPPERIASVTRGELAEIPSVRKYKASIDPLTLEINDCNQNDSSVYTCHLLYKTEEYIHWCKTAYPVITVENRSLYSKPGGNVRFVYSVSSCCFPVDVQLCKTSPGMESYIDPTTIQEDIDKVVQIEKVQISDNNTVYKLTAKNSFGESVTTCTLFVGERPEITVDKQSYMVEKGEEVTLIIVIKSDLKVRSVRWERMDEDSIDELNKRNTRQRYYGGTTETPSLTIKGVGDSEIGKYICFVENDIGTSLSDEISVVYKDRLNECQNRRMYTADHLAKADGNLLQGQYSLPKLDAALARQKSKEYLEEEIRVVCIGKSGVGKSATCNTLAGKNIFKSTCSPTGVTERTEYVKTDVLGSKVLIIDTPGIFESKKDEENKRKEIKRCVEIGAPGIHAFLFVMEIDRFREEDQEVIKTFAEYFGRENLENHTILVFTHSDKLQTDKKTIGNFLDEANEVLKTFLEKCGRRFVSIENSLQFQNSYNHRQLLLNAITSLKTYKDIGFILDQVENEIELYEEKLAQHVVDLFDISLKKAEAANQKALEQLSSMTEIGNEKQIEIIKSQMDNTRGELEKLKADCEDQLSNIREKVRQDVQKEPIQLKFEKHLYCA